MTVRGTAVLVSLLALVACEKASKISTGSLSGKAVYAGKADSSGIAVTAGGYSATTAADGSYSFAALPVGPYQVTAIAPASAERVMTMSVTVNSGANTANTITFTPSLALAGQLTVMGSPLAGATVSLDGAATTTTDANGVYSFATAAPGQHTLSFASGTNADQIPVVLYSPDTGASVPATYTNELFQLRPFDLQNAKRVTSINTRSPSRSVNLSPALSPDGAYYFFGLSNDQGTTSLYLGSTAGGAPVLVTDNADSGNTPKFAPTSTHLAYARRVPGTTSPPTPDRYELYAVKLTAGQPPVLDAPKTLSINVSSGAWDFSAQTTATPSVYLMETGTLREVNVDALPINTTWAGVEWWQQAKKAKRLVFKQASGATNRIGSVAIDATTHTSPEFVYESANVAFSATFWGFSPDESKFAYWVPAAAGAQGLKLASTTAQSVVALSTDASVSCVTFKPDGTRLAWDRGGLGGIVTAAATGGTVASYYSNGTRPTYTGYYGNATAPCPVFTDDDRIWLIYAEGAPSAQKLALAPADASATPTVFFTDGNSNTTSDLYLVSFGRNGAVYTRFNFYSWSGGMSFWAKGLGATAATQFDTSNYYYYGGLMAFPAAGGATMYWKYDPNANYARNAFWVSLTGTSYTPKSLATNCSTTSAPMSADQTKALMWDQPTGGSVRVSTVDLATGTKTTLMREASSYAGLQTVGATPTTKFVGLRLNTPVPYDFQDGLYIADVP